MKHLLRQLREGRHGIVYCRRGLRVPKAVALTFDDGPSRWTEPILDALDAAGGHGTFFVLGSAIAGREEVLRRAAQTEHELGNHLWSHRDPATLSDVELREELVRTSRAVEDAAGVRPRLFRPPYADTNRRVARVARESGFPRTVLRSVDPADWRDPDADVVVGRVLERVVKGAIICLHDGVSPDEAGGRDHTVAAVERLAEELPARGFALLTVSELLA